LKEKKENISVRELFRQKLEKAEIMPDASVKPKLMRKLAVREFLHFNPARFNVYYLGGIMIMGLAIALVLTSLTEKSGKPEDVAVKKELNDTVGIINRAEPLIQYDIQKPESLVVDINEKEKNNETGNSGAVTAREVTTKEIGSEGISSDTESIKSSNVVDSSFDPKELFSKPSGGNSGNQVKLKEEELIFESSVDEGCAPLKVLFHNNFSEYDSCRWTFGDGGSSDKGDTQWIFDVDGEFRVVLEVFGSDGLKKTYDKVITVHPKPKASFEISPAKAVLPDDEIRFLNYSVDAVRYNWSFGDGNSSELFDPTHRYEKFGHFNVGLVAFSEYGCSDSLVVVNAFADSEYFIEFPNAFIPNVGGPSGGFYSAKSDEAAQIFHPSFSGVSEYQLKVFSKTGLLIFESNDINIGWDGYFNGQLCNCGVYIWKVRGNFRNGEPFTRLGDITLLRY